MVIRMGLFDKIKKMFTKEEKEPRVEEINNDKIEEVIAKEENA